MKNQNDEGILGFEDVVFPETKGKNINEEQEDA